MERYRNNTRTLLLVELLIIVAVICGAFFIPFKEIPVYTMETYTVTEYQRQSFQETEEYEMKRTRMDDLLLDLRLELNGNQWWRVWIKQSTEKINFYASSWDAENENPMFSLTLEPESTITMKWLTLWPSSKEVHGLTINEDEFSIPGNLTNDPDAIKNYIIDHALEHQYGAKGTITSQIEGTIMMGLIHEDTEKTDTPQVLNVRFSHQWDNIETATREVTRYRSVPVEIEKQRPVILTPRYSMWQLIFNGKFIPLIKGEL